MTTTEKAIFHAIIKAIHKIEGIYHGDFRQEVGEYSGNEILFAYLKTTDGSNHFWTMINTLVHDKIIRQENSEDGRYFYEPSEMTFEILSDYYLQEN